ncbi:MAG TPA: transcriptional regulator [Acidimicrobiales bacterium]|nr:transcriptional regulator [Acidimicrobiales bacterium]
MSEDMTPAYARSIGTRLRDIRRQQGFSLQAVEARSGGEFKASVLGAYERGERIISVLRLARLAQLYGVPVDQLLPQAGGSANGAVTPEEAPVTIDLGALDALSDRTPEATIVRRYVARISVQRGDFNGRMITIRMEDVRALGRVFGWEEHRLRRRLEELGVLR